MVTIDKVYNTQLPAPGDYCLADRAHRAVVGKELDLPREVEENVLVLAHCV